MAEIELGNGLPDVRTTAETADSLRAAGFEVLDTRDLALEADVPWWDPVDPDSWRLGSECQMYELWAGFGWDSGGSGALLRGGQLFQCGPRLLWMAGRLRKGEQRGRGCWMLGVWRWQPTQGVVAATHQGVPANDPADSCGALQVSAILVTFKFGLFGIEQPRQTVSR
jgi:hypothetical protein